MTPPHWSTRGPGWWGELLCRAGERHDDVVEGSKTLDCWRRKRAQMTQGLPVARLQREGLDSR